MRGAPEWMASADVGRRYHALLFAQRPRVGTVFTLVARVDYRDRTRNTAISIMDADD